MTRPSAPWVVSASNPEKPPRFKQWGLSKLPTGDELIDRIQDRICEAFNRLIGKVLFMPPRFTTASLPIASPEWLGRLVTVRDEGPPATAEVLKVCLYNAAGNFEWVTVATSS